MALLKNGDLSLNHQISNFVIFILRFLTWFSNGGKRFKAVLGYMFGTQPTCADQNIVGICKNNEKQECIPVGCVLVPATHAPTSMHTPVTHAPPLHMPPCHAHLPTMHAPIHAYPLYMHPPCMPPLVDRQTPVRL